MLDFIVNRNTCTRCGECAADCPAGVIVMAYGGLPHVPPEKESGCYRCQHCLAICPAGSVSILGLNPERSIRLQGSRPDPEQLATLMKGRRSVRRYRDEDLEPELIQRLLDVAWHAPTGVNSRQVRFTVVETREKMAKLRDEVMAGLAWLVQNRELPERYSFYAGLIRAWEEEQRDVIFRAAPHLLVASAPPDAPCPGPDCMIALSYFELIAQAHGIGTLWCGLAKYTIADLLPDVRESLGIPEGHVVGYVMLFGKPAVAYQRTVQHGPAMIHRVR